MLGYAAPDARLTKHAFKRHGGAAEGRQLTYNLRYIWRMS